MSALRHEWQVEPNQMRKEEHSISRRSVLAVVVAMLMLGALGPAHALADEYGFQEVGASESTPQAGAHPDFTTSFVLKQHEGPLGPAVNATPKDISIELPPGLIGNPNAVPQCSTAEFFGLACSADSQVGVTALLIERFGGGIFHAPVFNMKPPGRDVVARLGFLALFNPVIVDISVRSGGDYGITASVINANDQLGLLSASTTLWGVPADPSHDTERVLEYEAIFCGGSGEPCFVGGSRASGLSPAPFTTNPTSCGPVEVDYSTDSYQEAGHFVTASAPLPDITGCDKVGFDPTLSLKPESRRAASPTGLDSTLEVPQDEGAKSIATSALRRATVTLPEGLVISPGAADGLEACSAEQVGFGEESPSACPLAAKIGSATLVSPDLGQPLQGSIYQRMPLGKGHLFGIWLVADDLGLHLKIPGEVEADAATGRLTTIFSNTPPLPVSEIALHFKGGPRAPLRTPDSCGKYEAQFELEPWSGNPSVVNHVPMSFDEACNTGGFAPTLEAGTTNPVAGAHGTFVTEINRKDGEQNVGSLDVSLPPGVAATLAGVPLCGDSAAVDGNCPAGSKVGIAMVASGVGSNPLWIPQAGKAPTAVFLAGPYRGAPYSLVVAVPAQAGPFDLGMVVTRAAIEVDPTTAQVTVKSDPLPQILEGVPISYRSIHVDVNRPDFALNPTSCSPMAIDSTISSSQGAIASPSSRFQVGSCADLGFKPKLALSLKGGTDRGKLPALRAVLTMPKGGANIRRVQVALPHSEFLDNAHIRTICTRVQFAADQCPAASVYGHARAITPLLDRPLEGPVYLRSSNHQLPDLVADLNGQIHVVLDGRIDSVNGGIRSTFAAVPDAPVSKFVLEMQGGKKGLLQNSTNLCAQANHATAKFDGQNGKVHDFNPVLANSCGKKAKRHATKHRR